MTDFSALDRLLSDRFSQREDQAIVVLGPGASADEIEQSALSPFLVVAVNDAELVFPADICVYHGDWVAERLSAAGPVSSLYVIGQHSKEVRGATCLRVAMPPPEEDAAQMSIQRLLMADILLEQIVFMTALQIAARARRLAGRPLEVFMVGFDFDSGAGYSRKVRGSEFRRSHPDLLVKMAGHAEYFQRASRTLRSMEVVVQHVGDRAFSDLGPVEFNQRFGENGLDSSQSGADRTKGAVEIVAEITTNHFGDRHRLGAMIRACAAAGADYVKLQMRDVDTFYTSEQLNSYYLSPFGETFGDYRRKLELSVDDFQYVDRLTKLLGIQWFASVLDLPSLEVMTQFEMPFLKLPSTISDYRPYLQEVARRYQGPVVVSTGMTDFSYESFVLETFRQNERIFMLQCNSAYPTPLRDCNIRVVSHYAEIAKDLPQVVPGYSSHDPGWFGSALAIAAGAKMVEKHVKRGSTEWAHFDVVALDLVGDDFRDFVLHLRDAELALGDGVKGLSPSEHHKY